MLVVIFRDHHRYDRATQIPVTESPTDIFHDMGVQECARAVHSFVKSTKSDINYEYLAILDERSVTDSTVLLVENDVRGCEISVLRAAPEVANVTLARISAGVGSFSECAEIAAKETDNVYRLRLAEREADHNTDPQKTAPRKELGRPTQ